MDLYHSEIRLPDNFVAPRGRVALDWTRHALNAANDDRYGEIPVFKHARLENLKVIEVGVEAGRVAKILFRGRIDSERDLCMVLIPGTGAWTVKTVWVNLFTDRHTTLDRNKYMR